MPLGGFSFNGFGEEMTVTCVAWARIPTPFLPDSPSMASVCQAAEGNAGKQPEMEMITTSLCLLTENWYLLANCCQHVTQNHAE